MSRSLRLVVVASLCATACGSSLPPRVVRVRDLPAAVPIRVEPGQALVLEFDEGDTIPLHFSLDGNLASTPADTPPIPLRIKRHFFLKIDGKKVTTSVDGVHFGEPRRPGTFRFGVEAHPESGVTAEMRIVTPEH
jgi:hypothetical protein